MNVSLIKRSYQLSGVVLLPVSLSDGMRSFFKLPVKEVLALSSLKKRGVAIVSHGDGSVALIHLGLEI